MVSVSLWLCSAPSSNSHKPGNFSREKHIEVFHQISDMMLSMDGVRFLLLLLLLVAVHCQWLMFTIKRVPSKQPKTTKYMLEQDDDDDNKYSTCMHVHTYLLYKFTSHGTAIARPGTYRVRTHCFFLLWIFSACHRKYSERASERIYALIHS